MPTSFTESNVHFEFADGYRVTKYDGWTYYRKHFQGCADSAAVDFLVLAEDGSDCWLLEVKDFTFEAPKPEKGPLADIVTRKVRDTLAGLLAAVTNANVAEERDFAAQVSRTNRLRVCFHVERPTTGPRALRTLPDRADLVQKLRTTLRPVDTKVEVTDTSLPSPKVPWRATWQPTPARNP